MWYSTLTVYGTVVVDLLVVQVLEGENVSECQLQQFVGERTSKC